MSTLQGLSTIAGADGSDMSPGDLADLIGVFNEVTAKLERTHEQLRDEVARLSAELQDANEALQRSRRLAALGEMAAGISHEIRNPLGSIKLHTGMLLDDLEGMHDQCETVRKIDAAVRGLDRIVGDVLAFSREITVRAADHGARELLNDALDACAADTKGIETRVAIGDGAGSVVCDAHLTRQALVNLIRNAAQAIRDAGGTSIELHAARSRDHEGAKDGVELRVIDDGPGLGDDVIERMFNPFFTTRAAGTGLGLAIVHRIAEAHGGCVRVRNNADETDETTGASGACVAVWVPMTPAGAQPAPIVVRAGAMPAPRAETDTHAAATSAAADTRAGAPDNEVER